MPWRWRKHSYRRFNKRNSCFALPSLLVSNVKSRVYVSLFKIAYSKNVRLQTSHFIIVWQFTEVYSSPERFTEIYIFPAFYQTEETMPIPRTQIQFVQFLNKMSGPLPPTVNCTLPQLSTWSMVHGQGNVPSPQEIASHKNYIRCINKDISTFIKDYKIHSIRNNFPCRCWKITL